MALSVTWITSWLCFILLCSRLFRPQFYCAAQVDGVLSQLQWTDSDNHKRLRVSLRNSQLQEAEAAQVSFAQLELHNIHPTESTIIYSVSTTAEETSWVDPKTGEVRYWRSTSEGGWNDNEFDRRNDEDLRVMSEENEEYRRQMHVSRIPGNFLQLGPDQVAVLALSFFPRFPPNHEIHNVQKTTEFYAKGPSTAKSKYEYADWEDWVQSTNSRRNNLAFEHFPRKASYQVKTTLVIETNTETLRIPISGSSAIQNKYGIPSMIMLDGKENEVTPKETQEVDLRNDVFVVSRVHPQLRGMRYFEQDNLSKESDCFDLFIRHPYHSRRRKDPRYSDEPDIDPPVENLEVKEVSVTRPDIVGVRWHSNSYGSLDQKASTRRSIKRWGEGGPLSVPPDDAPHYFVTVCSSAAAGSNSDTKTNFESGDELIDLLSNQPQSMGFLQIRTSHDNLLVALEKKRNLEGEETTFQVKTTKDYDFDQPENSIKDQKIDLNVSTGMSIGRNEIRAVPESLHHLFVLTQEEDVDGTDRTFTFGLKNEADSSIRILRVSVLTSSRLSGIAVRMKKLKSVLSGLITRGAFVSDALSLECSVDWGGVLRTSSSADFSVEGSILVRAVAITKSKKETAHEADPFRNSILLEIPWVIRVVAGKIDLVAEEESSRFLKLGNAIGNQLHTVKGAFFPLDPRLSEATSSGTSHEARLLVFTDMRGLIRLSDVEILDQYNNPVQASPQAESRCSRLQVNLATKSPLHDGDEILGQITLTYQLLNEEDWHSEEQGGNQLPIWCFLSFTTIPSTGHHITPVAIYYGSIDVSGSPFLSLSEPEQKGEKQGEIGQNWSRAAVGVDNVLDWLNTARIGSALHAVLADSMGRNEGSKWDKNLLNRYLYSLSGKIGKGGNSRFEPVLLNIGAISQGDVESFPLYLTNHNPVPITVSIDVSEVEGSGIILGQDQSTGSGDGNNPLDYLPPKGSKDTKVSDKKLLKGTFGGHPVDGLRQFLLRDATVNDFLSQFSFRDAVSMSKAAVSRSFLLRGIFGESARETFHRRGSPKNHDDYGSDSFPEFYGPFSRKVRAENSLLGPIVLSQDGRKMRRISVRRRAQSSGASTEPSVSIPPGGSARFDIFVRSPPAEVLEQDITRFLSAGLVLSTDHGQIIPILTTFEALQGKLDVSHIPTPVFSSTSQDGIIQVPLGLFGNRSWTSKQSTPVYVPPNIKDEDNGLAATHVGIISRNSSDIDRVSLFMRSSFSRGMKVRRIASCNPWFKVELSETQENSDSSFDSFLGVNVGSIRSVIICNGASGSEVIPDVSFPSFFRCVTDWLLHRADLQPRGCGSLPPVDGRRSYTSDVPLSRALDKVVKILKTAVKSFEQSDVDDIGYSGDRATCDSGYPPLKSKSRVGDGTVSPAVLRAAAETSEAWRTITDLGLHSIATSLRAIVEYNATPRELASFSSGKTTEYEEENHVLAVVIRNVTVKTILEVPLLVDAKLAKVRLPFFARGDDNKPSTLGFPPTLVGAVNSIRIPLHNPTAVPVRVRLAVAPFDKESTWKDGRSVDEAVMNFVGQRRSPYIQSSSSGPTARADEVNSQWWGPDRAYFHADSNGDIIRAHQNVTIKAGSGAQFTLIDPSVMSNNAFLAGCGRRCGLSEDSNVQKKTPFVHGLVDHNPVSPIGASAAAGHFLVGHGSTVSKVKKIRLGEGLESGGSMMLAGSGPSAFSVPLEGLGEVIIPPFGKAEVGPILFRPPGRSTKIGCAAFSGSVPNNHCESNSFESLILLENSLSGIERILLSGKSMWTKLDFVDPGPSADEDEFGDIVFRGGRSTLMFPGSASVENGYPRPVVKQLVLHNFGESTVNVTKMTFIQGASSSQANMCSIGEFDLFTGFEEDSSHFLLSPGDNFSFSIHHRPTCRRSKDFVTLSVQYSHVQTQIKDDKHTATILPFHSYSVNLTVGYDMTDWEFQSCTSHYVAWRSAISQSGNCNFTAVSAWIVSSLLKWSLIILTLRYMFGRSIIRRRYSVTFNSFLKRGQREDTDTDLVATHEMGKDWFAAFRCLARVEPSPVDLQTLGREQTRQIVLHRYRMMKTPPPQYFTGTGIFSRERIIAASHSASKQAVTMRTLSDGLFGNFVPSKTRKQVRLPCQLGWRTATARGIINSDSWNSTILRLETKILSEHRGSHSAFTYDSQGDQSSDASENTGLSLTSHASASLNEAPYEKEAIVQYNENDAVPLLPVPFTEENKTVKVKEPKVPKPTTEAVNLEKKDADEKALESLQEDGYQERTVPSKTQKLHEKTSQTATERSSTENAKGRTVVEALQEGTDAKQRITKDLKHGKIPKHEKLQENRKKSALLNSTTKEPSGKSISEPVRTEKKAHVRKKASSRTNPWKSATSVVVNSHDSESSQKIRPPPGLAPPPGFSSYLSAEAVISEATGSRPLPRGPTAAKSHTNQLLHSGDSSEVSLFASDEKPLPSQQSSADQSDEPFLSQTYPNRVPESSYISESAEFDVMAFLDDILNEGSMSNNETAGLGGPRQEVLVHEEPPAFSPNPWATSDIYQSRAAAYGILIEDESNRESESVDLPVLTPEAILSSAVNRGEDESASKSMSFFSDFVDQE